MKPVKDHLKYRKEKNNPLRHLYGILTVKRYFAGYALITLVALGGAMLMPFSAPFLINNVGVTWLELPLIYLLTGIAGVFIMILIGKLSDLFPKKKVFMIGTIISIILTIIYTNLTPIPLWQVIVINIILFIGTNGRLIPAMALNTAVPQPQDRGAYMSLCSALQQLANGIGALLAGSIIIQHTKSSPLLYYNTVGYIVCAVTVVCVFLIYQVARDIGRKH